MAISRKGLRHIVVDEQQYYWIAKGTDYGIDLTICADRHSGQMLRANFAYHHTMVSTEYGCHGDFQSQFVVTPAVVREAIQFGLADGWLPLKKGPYLWLKRPDEAFETVRNFLAAKPGTNAKPSTFSPHPS